MSSFNPLERIHPKNGNCSCERALQRVLSNIDLTVSSTYSKLNASPCESKQILLLKYLRRLSPKEESEKGTLLEYFFVACSKFLSCFHLFKLIFAA